MAQTNINDSVDEAAKAWNPPPNKYLRLDIDAAVNEQLNIYGVAGVVRNRDGKMVLASGKRIAQPISVVHTELLAIQERLKLVCKRWLVCTHIYSDSHMAVQTVMNPSSNFGYIDSCAQEIKNQIREP